MTERTVVEERFEESVEVRKARARASRQGCDLTDYELWRENDKSTGVAIFTLFVIVGFACFLLGVLAGSGVAP